MTESRPIWVVAPANDPLAAAVVQHLVSTPGSSRRRRVFTPVPGGAYEKAWVGQVIPMDQDRNVPMTEQAVSVRVSLLQNIEQATGYDYLLLGATKAQRAGSMFAMAKNRLARAETIVSVNGNSVGSQRIVLMPQEKDGKELARNVQVAHVLSALIMRQRQFNPWTLRFPSDPIDYHRAALDRWVTKGVPTTAVSAACLNATSDRRGIVGSLNANAVSLLVAAAQATFAQMPATEGWHISTFGPGDLAFLQDLGIQRVLLPYMISRLEDGEAGVAHVRRDMERNYTLMEGLIGRLDDALPFPVMLHEIKDGAAELEIGELIRQAERRAELMMPYLIEHPPKIFATLPREEWPIRVRQEAFLYLLDSLRYAGREGFWQLAIEVHGGYLVSGNLHMLEDGRRWPLGFFPDAVRQHWGDWTHTGNMLHERTRMSRLLSVC